MTAPVTVPGRPILRDIPDVELLKVGSWPASTGQVDFTPSDLAACVAAFSAPSIRKPVIKLGHSDPRFDGEPAVGFVDNLRLADNGSTLVGDLRGLPAWLADICASAFPDRSIEGAFGLTDQTGRKHDFALTGLALLGVQPPAVGTLTSLNDVARLYGIELATTNPEGTVIIMADSTAAPAAPAPGTTESTDTGETTTGGTLSVEDIRRAFYESGPGQHQWWWIEEMYLDPTVLIVQDDDNGELLRIPFTVTGTEIAWGEPEKVRREYVAASLRGAPRATWSTATLSRGGSTVAAATPTGKGAVMAAAETTFTADEVAAITAALRLPDNTASGDIVAGVQLLVDGVTAALGLDDTADIAAIVSAAEDSASAAVAAASSSSDSAASIAAAAQRKGMVAVDASAFADIQAQAQRGADLADRVEREDRERFVASAVKAGKIPSSRREHWLSMLESDPGARDVLASFPDNTVPMQATGYDGNADVPDTRSGSAYKALEG